MVGGLTIFGMFVGTISAGMVARLSKRLELQKWISMNSSTTWSSAAGTDLGPPLYASCSARVHRITALLCSSRKVRSRRQIFIDKGLKERLYHQQGRLDACAHLGGGQHPRGLGSDPTDRRDHRALGPRQGQRTVLSALTIEQMNPEIYTIAEVTGQRQNEMLRHAGVEEIVVGDWYAGVILGSASRNQGLVRLLDQVLTTEYGNAFYTLTVPNDCDGKTVAQLHAFLMEEHRALMISVENETGTLDVNPPPEQHVRSGQQIVVLANVIDGWI